MTVGAQKLPVTVPSFLTLTLGLMSSMTALVLHRWRRPTTMVMSEAWLNEHARIDSHRGWD